MGARSAIFAIADGEAISLAAHRPLCYHAVMMKRSLWLTFLGILFFGVAVALLSFVALRMVSQHSQATRGVALGVLPADLPLRSSGSPYGVNVALQTDQANLEQSLDLVQQGGFLWIRQHFSWAEIEQQRGDYQWTTYDRLVDAALKRGLKIVAVVDTSPSWARESHLVSAPPDNMDDYGAFVAAFVAHYSGRIGYVQVWDEPNVAPHWGERWASPDEYVAMLKATYARAKIANPDVQILAGGLAPALWAAGMVQSLNNTGCDPQHCAPSICSFTAGCSRTSRLRNVEVCSNDKSTTKPRQVVDWQRCCSAQD